MFEIYSDLFIGSQHDCFYGNRDEWAVIHACKSPCHQKALGYRGNLPSTDPHYLVYEAGNHLFLNIIDPPKPLFKIPLFIRSLDFIDRHISDRKVLIHCNHGFSRAPSIALLYLAKRLKLINNDSYEAAFSDFKEIYPYYQPGTGIAIYLSRNWQILNNK